MKKITNLVLVAVLFVTLSFCSLTSSAQTLTEYNNQVLYHYTLLDNQIAKFESSIWDDAVTVEKLNKEFKMAKNIVKYNYPVLKAISPNSKDKYFYKSVINFYDVVSGTLDDEFQQVIDMYNQTWKDEFGTKISEVDKKAVDKILKAEDNVIEMQKKFADANDLDLN